MTITSTVDEVTPDLTRLRFLITRPGGRRMLSRSGKTLRRILDEDDARQLASNDA